MLEEITALLAAASTAIVLSLALFSRQRRRAAAHAEGNAVAVNHVVGGGGVHGVLLDAVAWGGGDHNLPGGSDDSRTHVEGDSAGY